MKAWILSLYHVAKDNYIFAGSKVLASTTFPHPAQQPSYDENPQWSTKVPSSLLLLA